MRKKYFIDDVSEISIHSLLQLYYTWIMTLKQRLMWKPTSIQVGKSVFQSNPSFDSSLCIRSGSYGTKAHCTFSVSRFSFVWKAISLSKKAFCMNSTTMILSQLRLLQPLCFQLICLLTRCSKLVGDERSLDDFSVVFSSLFFLKLNYL